MAVNNERSMNHDLLLGVTDRSMHSVLPSRGGQADMAGPVQRNQRYLRGSWTPEYLSEAIDREARPEKYTFDAGLRDRISIITGPTARTRPFARNQFEASPYDSPLDTTHTSWPDRW